MRSPLVAILALTLVTGSAVGVTAQEAEPAGGAAAAAGNACGIPDSEYLGPGYYLYEGGPDYRWCDFRGKWVGPKVDVTIALIATILVWLGADTRVFRHLSTWVEPGAPTTTGEQRPQIDPIPIIARALRGEEPYQNYRLNWGDTSNIAFNGRVTGSGDKWRYDSVGQPIGGNQSFDRTNDAKAWCTFTPSPFQVEKPVLFHCEVLFGNGEFWERTDYVFTEKRGQNDFKMHARWDTTGFKLLSCDPDPEKAC